MATPHVTLCKTAAHLEECGECADQIVRIVRDELHAGMQALPPLSEVSPSVEEGEGLSGLMTSHADIPNGVDHPVEFAAKCGLCIKAKRQAGQKPAPPGAILTQLESL